MDWLRGMEMYEKEVNELLENESISYGCHLSKMVKSKCSGIVRSDGSRMKIGLNSICIYLSPT